MRRDELIGWQFAALPTSYSYFELSEISPSAISCCTLGASNSADLNVKRPGHAISSQWLVCGPLTVQWTANFGSTSAVLTFLDFASARMLPRLAHSDSSQPCSLNVPDTEREPSQPGNVRKQNIKMTRASACRGGHMSASHHEQSQRDNPLERTTQHRTSWALSSPPGAPSEPKVKTVTGFGGWSTHPSGRPSWSLNVLC